MSFPDQVNSGGLCRDRSSGSLRIGEHVHGWIGREMKRAKDKEDRVRETSLERLVVKEGDPL